MVGEWFPSSSDELLLVKVGLDLCAERTADVRSDLDVAIGRIDALLCLLADYT